jgi:hypothetical protein
VRDQEKDTIELLIVTTNLAILSVNVKDFTVRQLVASEVFENAFAGIKECDKVVRFMHWNRAANQLVISLVNSEMLPVIDLSSGEIVWTLPAMQECGLPLCMASDIDKLLVVYDSNKLVLFDLLN